MGIIVIILLSIKILYKINAEAYAPAFIFDSRFLVENQAAALSILSTFLFISSTCFMKRVTLSSA